MCKGTVCSPSATWIGTCSQPAMQLSLRNALLAPTDAVCLREAHLPRIRSQRSTLGIHGVEMKAEPDTKKGHPNKIAKKFSKASGNLRAMPILVISNGWITTKEAGESVKRKFEWFARSLSPGMFHRPQVMAEGELPLESVMARRGLRNRHKLAEMGLKF